MGDDVWDYKLHQQIAKLGAKMDPDVRQSSIDLFMPMHPEAPVHNVYRDLSYGPDSRHRLDVHVPPVLATALPVFCFIHGGGFVAGDKTREGQPFYDNICRWAVGCNFVAVNITYRLAPESMFPAGAEDVAAALQWVESNIGQYGGNPEAVVVMGHSAGAAHVASFVTRAPLLQSLRWTPAGVIVSSGIYDPTINPDNHLAYYGDDASQLPLRAAVAGLCSLNIPLLVSTAEFDPPKIQIQTFNLIDKYFKQKGLFPELVQAQGHNHFTVMLHIGTEEKWFTSRLRRFVEGVTSERID